MIVVMPSLSSPYLVYAKDLIQIIFQVVLTGAAVGRI